MARMPEGVRLSRRGQVGRFRCRGRRRGLENRCPKRPMVVSTLLWPSTSKPPRPSAATLPTVRRGRPDDTARGVTWVGGEALHEAWRYTGGWRCDQGLACSSWAATAISRSSRP